MTIHPAVRIVLLCVFVAGVAGGQPRELVFGAGLLAAAYGYGRAPLRPALTMLRRLRWFLMSILVVFLWFTPGEAPRWLQALGQWAPTVEGAHAGALRVAALVLIVAAVNLLLQSTSRDQLLGAICWLASPLRAGDAGQRLAVRATLALDKVSAMQQRVGAERQARMGARGSRMTRARNLAVGLVQNALDAAENEPLQRLVIDRPVAPPPAQWLWPVTIGLILTAL